MLTAAVLMLTTLQGLSTCKTYLLLNPAPALFEKDRSSTVELAPIAPDVAWTEAIPSWNMDHSEQAQLTVEARVLYPDHATKYYSFGAWSGSRLIGSKFS